jgi:glycosyltransferase involved in cell wall biosynthesis
VERCDRLVVNTPGAEALYKTHYPEWAAKVVSIPNGYDRLNIADPPTPGAKFTIMHVGNFYGSRVPDALLAALDDIANPEIEFVQVGAVEGIEGRRDVRVIDRVPHEEALALMRTASLLYLKQGFEGSHIDHIAVAAKTYEYLATGLPILADCPEGDNAEIVRRYCRNPYVVLSGRKADLKNAVLAAFAARQTTPRAISEEFEREFNRPRLTARLAHLFDEVADRSISWEGNRR